MGVSSATVTKFGLSRTAVNRYLRKLEEEKLIAGSGNTSSRTYSLLPISKQVKRVEVTANTSENDVWRIEIEPHLKDVPDNIFRICQYAFTEMFNNVIDHSSSPEALITYQQNYATIDMSILDFGVGIFEKIRSDFKLDDPRSALLELSKGKLTSDSSKHSGEGIFFTSRMFDVFSISSGNLFYRTRLDDDWGWLIESKDIESPTKGTSINMRLDTSTTRTPKEVFEKYQNDEYSFAKTHIPVSLNRYGHEYLVSRSQAKRLLARFERFEEVILDFAGIDEIGQAFADEIFRVFTLSHPEVRIVVFNANDAIRNMIAHAKSTDPSVDILY